MSGSRGRSGKKKGLHQRHSGSHMLRSGLFDGNKENKELVSSEFFVDGTVDDEDLLKAVDNATTGYTGSQKLAAKIRGVLSNSSLGTLDQLREIKILFSTKGGNNPARSYQLNKMIKSFNKYSLVNGKVNSAAVSSEIDFDPRMQPKRSEGPR